MKREILYVTGFRQHAGKTVTCLGIISQLKKIMDPGEIGYIKPVGQELITLPNGEIVDKDAQIIQEFSGIPDLDMSVISPVRLGTGFTKEFLSARDTEKKTAELKTGILHSFERLSRKKVILAEGTGHPGVGGIVGLSNADVSKLVGAKILYLSGGGIGKALDMLEVDLSYYLYKKCDVAGIIFNKLIPDKIETVKGFLTEELINGRYGGFPGKVGIYGYFPEINNLYKPSMRVILDKFEGSYPLGNPADQAWIKPCNDIRVVSLMAEYLYPEKYLKPGDIVLLGSASHSRKTKILSYHRTLSKLDALGGLILTCGATTPLDAEIEKEISGSGIPGLLVQEDTAMAEKIILDLFESTKLQLFDSDKIRLIEDLFAEHFDMKRLLRSFTFN